MEHKWRELTEEEIKEDPRFYTSEFRKCENCGLTTVPSGGIKAGHGTCEPIIVRQVMDD